MSLIYSKLCKFEINYAIFFSIISGNTIIGIEITKPFVLESLGSDFTRAAFHWRECSRLILVL